MSDRDALHIPRQVYKLRVLGLLAAHAFVFPHAAWRRARLSSDPHRVERQHLLVDSGVGGVVVALMGFALLPSILLITMLSMDKIGWGPRFPARSSSVMAAGFLVTAFVAAVPMDLYTTMPMVIASLPLMVAYPMAVASVSNRSGRLARERRVAIEQSVALREQLAHISDQSLRAGDIVRRMRTFSRRADATRESADVCDLIREVLGLLDHELRLAKVETQRRLEPVPPVNVDRIEIQQVLGLSICETLIEAHGGRIVVEPPSPGGGATFYFELPALRPESGQAHK